MPCTRFRADGSRAKRGVGVLAVLAFLAALAFLALSACALSTSEHLDDGVCSAGKKSCLGGCVAASDPDYGCASTTCDPCDLPKASASCVEGTCAVAACYPGRADCNGDPRDGCEADLEENAQTCGGCGNACSALHATPACRKSVCAIGACNDGFADCNGKLADGCETELGTSTNCGGCGASCTSGLKCTPRIVSGTWSARCE